MYFYQLVIYIGIYLAIHDSERNISGIYSTAQLKFPDWLFEDHRVLSNIGYTSENHLKLKSRENSLVHNIHFNNPFLHNARQEHCRALYKISKRLDNSDRCYGWTRFQEIWV